MDVGEAQKLLGERMNVDLACVRRQLQRESTFGLMLDAEARRPRVWL
jgi:hypothetical protein